jgi:hypothetical protein
MIWLNKNWSQSLYLSELFENLERPPRGGFFCSTHFATETKRELKMERKSPAEAGQTSRAWHQTR